jgi:hypothetical protein
LTRTGLGEPDIGFTGLFVLAGWRDIIGRRATSPASAEHEPLHGRRGVLLG